MTENSGKHRMTPVEKLREWDLRAEEALIEELQRQEKARILSPEPCFPSAAQLEADIKSEDEPLGPRIKLSKSYW